MGRCLNLQWVEEIIAHRFPDPEPELLCVRAYRAVCCLLFSAALLGTIDPKRLHGFTGYHPAFLAAVAWNMRNNHLWTGTSYDASHWLSWSGELNKDAFLEDVSVAWGETWCDDAEFPHAKIDVYLVYKDLASVPDCQIEWPVTSD